MDPGWVKAAIGLEDGVTFGLPTYDLPTTYSLTSKYTIQSNTYSELGTDSNQVGLR